MAWYLALQGSTHMTTQSSVYELQDGLDVDMLVQELVSSATLDRVVAVPAVLAQNPRHRQKVTLYVRPAALGMWTFHQQSEEDRRQLVEQFNALSQAVQQRGHGSDGTDESAHRSDGTPSRVPRAHR